MTNTKPAAIAAMAAVLAACSPVGAAQETPSAPAAATAQARHPISGLEIIDVAVIRGDRRIVFKTELAATPEAQARGLMFRTELADDEAMLFPSDQPGTRGFWMKNTPLPLDIIFIGLDGRISNIAAMTVPYSTETVFSEGPASAVFEIRGGLAEELGIVPGDRLEYTLP
ncbi:MAG: DUF192 domain-containing protein [Erythrobacter sp.]|jgi:uncharacterized membrane protein (UPF0127 family)|nr:DUF192 domain-containing protein [Erythrobacter sp.]